VRNWLYNEYSSLADSRSTTWPQPAGLMPPGEQVQSAAVLHALDAAASRSPKRLRSASQGAEEAEAAALTEGAGWGSVFAADGRGWADGLGG